MFKTSNLRPINIASLFYGVFLAVYAIYWQIAMYSIYTSKGLEAYRLSSFKYFVTLLSWWKIVGFPFVFGLLFILFGIYGRKINLSEMLEKILFVIAFLMAVIVTNQSFIMGFVGMALVSFAALIQITFYEGRT